MITAAVKVFGYVPSVLPKELACRDGPNTCRKYRQCIWVTYFRLVSIPHCEKELPTSLLVIFPILVSSPRRCAFRARPSMPTDRVHARVGGGRTRDVTSLAQETRRDRFPTRVSCTSAQ